MGGARGSVEVPRCHLLEGFLSVALLPSEQDHGTRKINNHLMPIWTAGFFSPPIEEEGCCRNGPAISGGQCLHARDHGALQ